MYDSIMVEREVIECINEYKIIITNDHLHMLIKYAKLGGNVRELITNPTFEVSDISKEYRELRILNTKLIMGYSVN